MKLKIAAILLLVALTWSIPVKTVASKQTNEVEAIFINYESHHKKPEPAKEANPPKPVQQKPQIKKPVVSAPQRTQNRRDYPAGTADKEQVKQLIIKYANLYGINPEIPLCIAYYESGYNASAKNKSSTASGVFQYLASTWKATDEGKAGYSVFDPEANVKAAIKYMASRKSTQPWEVRSRCPKF